MIRPGAAPAPANQVGHFGLLDSLRGLAALWVVVSHIGSQAPHLRATLGERAFGWLFTNGAYGVEVFFVLSGWVIAHSTWKLRSTGSGIGRFLARRFVRLTPPYYAALVVAMAAGWFGGIVNGDGWVFPGFRTIGANMAYIARIIDAPMLNGVHWTLLLEMQFYLVAAVLLALVASGTSGRSVEAVVLGISVVPPVLGWSGGQTSVVSYWYTFAAGVILYHWHRGRVPSPFVAAFAGALIAAFALHRSPEVAATVMSIGGLALAERRHALGRWLQHRWLKMLGEISFSLYLIHINVVVGVFMVGRKVMPASTNSDIVLGVVGLICSLAASRLFWRLFEVPALRWSKQLRSEPVQS